VQPAESLTFDDADVAKLHEKLSNSTGSATAYDEFAASDGHEKRELALLSKYLDTYRDQDRVDLPNLLPHAESLWSRWMKSDVLIRHYAQVSW